MTKKICHGDIFRRKFKKDPAKMTLQEIDKVVFGDKKPTVRNFQNAVVSNRGSVFNHKNFDINKEFDAKIK